MEHTKEPWRHAGQGDIVAANGDDVAAVYLRSDQPDDANARRIVACVNACADVPIEVLEADNAKLATHAETVAHLTKQRDELLAALERIAAVSGGLPSDIALTAIASVKGGA